MGLVATNHPSPRAAPATKKAFRRDIQGLRGVAVVLVVLFHADGALTGGFIGVDVFFVLSGFLIGGLLYAEQRRDQHIDLARFFTRRARRLLPALSLLTTVTLVVSLLVVGLGDPLAVATGTGVAVSVFGANIYLYDAADYFAPAAELNPLLHTWSLSLEEQFYLALPVLLALIAWWSRKREFGSRITGLLIGGILTVAMLVSLWFNVELVDGAARLFPLGAPERFAFYAPVTRAWEFGAGVLLALLVATWKGPGRLGGRPVTDVLGILGLAAIGYAAWVYDATTPFPGTAALIPVLGTVLVLLAGTEHGYLGRLLSGRSLVWLGDISYSWYLWHWPFIVFAATLWPDSVLAVPVAAVGSLLPAWWSYRFVEERFRRDGSLVGRRVVVLVLIAIAVPVVTALSVSAANRLLAPQYGVAELPVGRANGCHFEADQEEPWPQDDCLFDLADDPAPLVLLLGDSHADALSDGALEAARAIGADLAVWSWSGREFVGDGESSPGGGVDTVASSFELIERLQPDVVLVANNAARPIAGPVDWLDEDPAGPQAAIDAWATEVDALFATLTDHGAAVVWSSVVPIYPSVEGLRVSVLRPEVEPAELELAEVARQRDAIRTGKQGVIDDHPEVIVFDPVPHLCGERCSNVVDGEPIYRDEDHLSPTGSRLLADPLADVLREALGRGGGT